MNNPVLTRVFFSPFISLCIILTMKLSLTLLKFLFLQNVVRSSAVLSNHPAETLDHLLKESRRVRDGRSLEGVAEMSDDERC